MLKSAERQQLRTQFDAGRAGGLFRSSSDKLTDPALRRSLGLKVAGGVNINVFIRVRPQLAFEAEAGDPIVIKVNEEKRTVSLKYVSALCVRAATRVPRGGGGAWRWCRRGLALDAHCALLRRCRAASSSTTKRTDSFQYNGTFAGGSKQTEVYEQVGKPVMQEVLQGMNCCIMAYGQTGTGKTYTMLGDLSKDTDEVDERGIIPRALAEIFGQASVVDEDTLTVLPRSSVSVSFLEIYNENLEDLLSPVVEADSSLAFSHAAAPGTPARSEAASAGAGPSTPMGATELKIVDDKDSGVVCQNLTEVHVHNCDEVMDLLQRAEARSRVTATRMNKQSKCVAFVPSVTVAVLLCCTPRSARLTTSCADAVGAAACVAAAARTASSRSTSPLGASRTATKRCAPWFSCGTCCGVHRLRPLPSVRVCNADYRGRAARPALRSVA
jgi:hypothetical protein